jgi:ATP-dependent Lon protease
MKLIIAPRDNEVDVEEIPKELLKKVKFEFVESIDQVLELALVSVRKSSKKKPTGKKKTAVSTNGASAKPRART